MGLLYLSRGKTKTSRIKDLSALAALVVAGGLNGMDLLERTYD
jgi:hypothetical protein